MGEIQYLISNLNNYSYDYNKFYNLSKDKEATLRLPKYVYRNDTVSNLICYEEILLLAYLSWNRNYKFRVVLLETLRHNQREEAHPYRVEDNLKFFIRIPEKGWALLGHSEISDPGSGWTILETAPTWSIMERKVRRYYKDKNIVQFREIDIMPLLAADSSVILYTEFQEYYLKSIKNIRKDIVDFTTISRGSDGTYSEVTSILLKSGERIYFN